MHEQVDERTALLRSGSVATAHDGDLDEIRRIESVKFDPNGDPECPLDWPMSYRWGIVALLAFMSFTTYILAEQEDSTRTDFDIQNFHLRWHRADCTTHRYGPRRPREQVR